MHRILENPRAYFKYERLDYMLSVLISKKSDLVKDSEVQFLESLNKVLAQIKRGKLPPSFI